MDGCAGPGEGKAVNGRDGGAGKRVPEASAKSCNLHGCIWLEGWMCLRIWLRGDLRQW